MRALLLVGLVGCFGGSAPPPAAPPPVQPAPVKHSAALGDPLGFLPADAQVVSVLDFKELRGSQLWQRLEPVLRQRAGTQLTQFADLCQFDPIAPLRRISIAVRDLNGTPSGVVVVRGYRRDLAMACVDKVSRESPDKLALDRARGVASVTENGQRVMFAFADDTTLVVRFGPTLDATAFGETMDSGAPLRMTPGFDELFGKVEPSHPMWVMVLDGSVFKGQTAGMNATALVASAKIGDTATAHLRLRLDDPANAATMATQIQGQVQAIAAMFGDITAVAEDVDLIVTAQMTSAQLDSLLSLLGPSLGIP